MLDIFEIVILDKESIDGLQYIFKNPFAQRTLSLIGFCFGKMIFITAGFINANWLLTINIKVS